ncbi:amino acid/amide ABC transporter membrane protein 2 (HAAT family) [Motilibacter rhizosphaerae]|uniref:Amino acid/amide ABC transporter membrane protein 2 (HAAT family) n=1 Tax=Motilibacter rhizosphaerae TaxID=598652 RepID=A0A4Q7NGF1_9ACTN|nr:branched-chain amino acid ABC transporter permease [Motilibacter rhizosphaerae]RZS82864.1 amino acid/amide ABC transporter membrane protein 2 (HAAT family) [Motilibacter rhizosphaerae]
MSTATVTTGAGRRSRRPLPRWSTVPAWGRWAAYALLFVLAILLPAIPGISTVMSPGNNWTGVLIYPVGLYILMALGLNVVVGYAGLLDLGYVAFFAIGAYTDAVMSTKYGWSFWESLPVGIALSMLAGIVLGTPTLRLRGDYLAIVTLGFGEIIRVTANNTDYLGGPRGISSIPRPSVDSSLPLSGQLQFGALHLRAYWYLIVVLIALVIIIAKRLEGSRVGRAWAAIREDEDAAELMGVPTLRFKLAAFAIGAAIAGAGGAVFASRQIAIVPDNFLFQLSALILAAVVLGGSGNVPGVILGAFLVAWLPERFRGFQEYRYLFFGAALVLIMLFRPEGLLPNSRRRAELEEGTGGMGSLGGGVGAAATQNVEVDE